jgi:hypothetical protein
MKTKLAPADFALEKSTICAVELLSCQIEISMPRALSAINSSLSVILVVESCSLFNQIRYSIPNLSFCAMGVNIPGKPLPLDLSLMKLMLYYGIPSPGQSVLFGAH